MILTNTIISVLIFSTFMSFRPILTSAIRLMSTAMEKHCVIPDVIPKPPNSVLEVCYPSGVKVDGGNELTPTQVKDIPTVKWEADPATFYTLCMTGIN